MINKYNLKLNLFKTEVMMIGSVFDNLNIKIVGYVLTKVISFKQIGSNINREIWKKTPSAAIIKMYGLLKDKKVLPLEVMKINNSDGVGM